jgi:serine/threonine protein phosphatase PrpC
LENGAAMLPDLDLDDTGFWREESETMSPMAEGMVIADRFMVLDVLDAQDESVLYYVRDLRRCWQCGHEGNAPDEAFCSQCGAALDRKPGGRLLEVHDPDHEPKAGGIVTAKLEYEGRHFLVLVEPEPTANDKPESRGIRLIVGQASDAGLVRELDEDSLLTLTMAPTYVSKTSPVLGLFAVADGMGGHEGGEVASKIALQTMGEHVLRTIILPEVAGEFTLDEDVVVRLRQATMEANDQVYLARQKRGNDMGTTLTTVLVRNERLFFAHVGDCRAYRWDADGLHQLTTDHSVVASMVATGQAEPEDLYTHPHRSVIYRSIGDQPTVQVDTDALRLTPGDRIIVCCDGLWEMIRDEGIADVMMQEADPQSACDLLIKRANAAGGEDNISVIVVQVEPA